jgi:subtilisin family serine protease
MERKAARWFESSATGRGVRIAVIDSGVHATHPHISGGPYAPDTLRGDPTAPLRVRGLAGGVAIDEDGREHADYVDRLGHGTAVTAAIKEKAPDAELYAVKVFDRTLTTSVETLIRAINWAAQSRMHLVNLSLGTTRQTHEPVLREAVERAAAHGVLIVAARDNEGVRWLPGSLPGVVPVQLDWDCPRDRYRVVEVDGVVVFRASGFPREIPGVPPARNLNGISFAVANMTGFVARGLEETLGARCSSAVTAARLWDAQAGAIHNR